MRANEVNALELILHSDEYRERFKASFGDTEVTFERITEASAAIRSCD